MSRREGRTHAKMTTLGVKNSKIQKKIKKKNPKQIHAHTQSCNEKYQIANYSCEEGWGGWVFWGGGRKAERRKPTCKVTVKLGKRAQDRLVHRVFV